MSWENAAASSPLFEQKKSIWGDPIAAQKSDNPANSNQAINNTKAAIQGAMQYLEPARQQQRREDLQDGKQLLDAGAGRRMAVDTNAGSSSVAMAKGGGLNNLVGSYRSPNNLNERADALYDAALSSNRKDNSDRMADNRKAENDQAIATTQANAAKFAASEQRAGTQAQANAQLGVGKAAADAARFGASEQARAGIFGSLFGSISGGQGGFRYW